MIRVLFVCLGNICRSPMAEATMRDRIEKAGLSDQIEVDSAGTGDYHEGKPPHAETRGILGKADISYEGMRARQVEEGDWEKFDYLIPMDRKNLRDLKAFEVAHDDIKVVKFMDYVASSESEDVPDPYFSGNFDEVYELITEGCDTLLEDIKQDHGL
ncbi:low molecular weight protein-tyrosine-phosphatase [Pontibacillus yanchengensis]|uniref:protein-tyrosine-phosphatase n=1 Tax=Pontibacillus yanchengensis Y32 TaxID=1385514 RepID=A0A0A2T940_9BACI|nr:low molecular weight protein-tyrosine-phosphatase [Pontibacillus yanchengensis]KGP72079.1 protein tyrosine phosphatase [Pontibacillus yanchengensis Y32]